MGSARRRARPLAPGNVDAVTRGLRTTVIRERSALAAIRDEWRALPPPAAAPAPSAGPEFLDAWLATLGAGAAPRVVAVRREGRLVGVVPLVAQALRPHEGGRQVSLAGSRRPPMTDMADARVEPGCERLVAAATADALGASAASWDTLYMGNVAASSRVFTALLAEAEHRGWAHASRARAAMVIETGGDWEAYRAGLGRSLRTLPRRVRRLAALGSLRVEPGLTGEEGARALADLIAVYRERWGPGNWLDDPRYRDFVERLRAALDPGGARVAGLWLDGRPLALQLILREGDRDQSLLVAADHRGATGRESPGTVLDYLLTKRAFEEATTEVHLLHTPTREKMAWATRLDAELTWIAVSPRARPAVALALPAVEAAIIGRAVARRRRPGGRR